MTPEGRVERLERIAKLFARAGRRARGDLRSQDEKINILIDLHMKNEELFARNEERFRENEERFAKNEEQFEERFARNEEQFEKWLARNEEWFEEWLAKSEERFARQDEKIQAILELQKQSQERFLEYEQRFVRTDERFAELAASQAATDWRLNSLIDLIRMDRNNPL
jgi:hypothetical protein